MSEDTVKDAIKKILADKDQYEKSLNWAVMYCRRALELNGEALVIQCLYILGNITHWRHADAKTVRQTLKLYIKEN